MIHITTSQVKEFKNCRFRWWLSYRELLRPHKTSEALEIGTSYHEKIEQILKNGTFNETNEITDAMAYAFMKYIYPKLPREIEPEQSFSVKLSEDVALDGKIDGVADGIIIEHKTKKGYIDEEYLYRVHFVDKQVTNYLIAAGGNTVQYTVISKPTIRQKKDESWKEYLKRCEEWYDTDTDKKVTTFYVYRTDEEKEKQKEDLIAIGKEMSSCTNFYKNESACLIVSCPFAGICNTYKHGDVLADFEKKVYENEELI